MQRWIVRLLVLAMIVPALGPLAMAYATPASAPHCVRQPAKPVMECHRGMSMPMAPEPSEAEFHTTHECCQNHQCCSTMSAPRWAQPRFNFFSHQSRASAETLGPFDSQPITSVFSSNVSARAPPRL